MNPERRVRKAAAWGRPAEQARSAATAARILDAVQALLEHHDFDRVTVPQIVARARCSVGAFYGRFRDKEALLEALDERYVERFVRSLEQAWERPDAGRAPIGEIVRGTLAALVRFHREHAGLVRTLMLRARQKPDAGYRLREQRVHALVPRFAALVQRRMARRAAPPDADRRLRFATMMVFLVMREMVLWAHLNRVAAMSDEEMISELTRAFLAYAGSQP